MKYIVSLNGKDYEVEVEQGEAILVDVRDTPVAAPVLPIPPIGVPFSTTGMGFTGDVLADLSEDMAAEEKARATYENLMDLTDDEKIDIVAKKILEKYLPAFEELAK